MMKKPKAHITGKLLFQGKKVLFMHHDEPHYVLTKFLSGSYISGDMVSAYIVTPRESGRLPEVRIDQLLERSNDTLLGTFMDENGETIFSILKEQGNFTKKFSRIPPGHEFGDIIMCKFSKTGELLLLQKFAKKNDFDVDERILFATSGIRTEFSKKVVDEAKQKDHDESSISHRRDFRDWYTLTIDGADAKDLDDAISIRERSEGGYTLAVHIADVSEYVTEGSALDSEALERGTSVYTPGKVVPMLPEELSNGLSSLHPGSPKLTLSLIMEIDDRGNVMSTEVMEGIIQSSYRGIYEEIEDIHTGKKECSDMELMTSISLLYQLYEILKKRRAKEGKIQFESTETYFHFEKGGDTKKEQIPLSVEKRKRLDAHMLIEECMVLANEEIAKWCQKKDIPFLSRVHGIPGKEQDRFIRFIMKRNNHHVSPSRDLHPKDLNEFMNSLEAQDIYLYSKLLLPKMAKALYKDRAEGHFGLALEYYAHFTSPIRRYPDLQIHRIIKEFLRKNLTPERKIHYKKLLPKVARHTSEGERRAETIERQFDSLYACRYMKERIGNIFSGRISGLSEFALFIELENGIEGTIPLARNMFRLDETGSQLFDQRKKIIATLGSPKKVKIESVDMKERRIYVSEYL